MFLSSVKRFRSKMLRKFQSDAYEMINSFRQRGHLVANLNPLERSSNSCCSISKYIKCRDLFMIIARCSKDSKFLA